MLRALYDVENQIALRNYSKAFTKLEEILKQDIYNVRALEFYCQINTIMGTPERVYALIKSNQPDFDKITPGTLITMAETLSSITGTDEAKALAEKTSGSALRHRAAYQSQKILYFPICFIKLW